MRHIAVCISLVLAQPAIVQAQELLLFAPSSFGEIILPQTESMAGGIQLEARIGAYNNEFIANYGTNSVFARAGRSVGRLDVLTNVGHAPCTAFLIEGNRLVTNHHCVPGVLDDPRMKEKGATVIAGVQFHAGFVRDGIEDGVRSFPVNPVPLETNVALDYSVLQVLGDANADFGALALSATVPQDRDPFWVIGHPMGEAQRISREKCQAASPAIAAGRVRHTCDTLPGNSGSPVIDAGLQRVVALHHAGSRAGDVNFAVPMADILAQSAVLRATPEPGDTGADERARLEEELAALRAERDRLRAAAEDAAARPAPAPAPQPEAEKTAPESFPWDPLINWNGMKLSAYHESGRGLLVRFVHPNSDAADRGIAEGDRIVFVENQDVGSLFGLEAAVRDARNEGRKTVVMLLVKRDGNGRILLLALE